MSIKKFFKFNRVLLLSPVVACFTLSCSYSESKYFASQEQIDEINRHLNDNDYFDLYEYSKKSNSANIFFNNKRKNQTDQIFMPYFENWFKKLSIDYFETNSQNKIINLYCNSQRQAMSLYLQSWGHFWNVPLHQQKPVIDTTLDKKYIHTIPHNNFLDQNNIQIRGKDYMQIQNALDKSISPISFVTYHGVEFMEIEFYNQLKKFIDQNIDGSFNYDKCKGQTIETYGFISSTLNKEIAYKFSDGFNWTNNDKKEPPFKEPVMFKIKVPKEAKGVAYVSGFELINQLDFSISDNEQQVLFNIGTQFKIENISKEGKVTIFEVLVV